MIVMAMAFLACVGAAPAGAAKVYVGDGAKRSYSVAFKTEAGRPYVLELSARASCEYDEAEAAAPVGLSAFPAPRPMRLRKRGFVAGEIDFHGRFNQEARVLANFAGAVLTGTYSLSLSEEFFSCETSFVKTPTFEARRYLPIGRLGATGPRRGEARVYYDAGGPTQFFARATPKFVAGIRGAFVAECPIGPRPSVDRPWPLYSRPAEVKVKDGSFAGRTRVSGRMPSGARYTETVVLSGRETKRAVIGTYKRVHTTRPKHGRPQRCVTGPLKIEARRYLPARR